MRDYDRFWMDTDEDGQKKPIGWETLTEDAVEEEANGAEEGSDFSEDLNPSDLEDDDDDEDMDEDVDEEEPEEGNEENSEDDYDDDEAFPPNRAIRNLSELKYIKNVRDYFFDENGFPVQFCYYEKPNHPGGWFVKEDEQHQLHICSYDAIRTLL